MKECDNSTRKIHRSINFILSMMWKQHRSLLWSHTIMDRREIPTTYRRD